MNKLAGGIVKFFENTFGARVTAYIIFSLILLAVAVVVVWHPELDKNEFLNRFYYLGICVTGILSVFGIMTVYRHSKVDDNKNLQSLMNDTFKCQQPYLVDAIGNLVNKAIISQQPALTNALETAILNVDKYKQETHKKDWRINNECNKAIYNELEQAILRTNADHMLYGEFHNGTESNMGIPFCKFSIIMATPGIEKFTEDYNQENISKYSIIQRKLKPNHWVVLNIDEVKECDKRLYSDMKYYNLYKIAMFQISNPDEDDYPLGFVSAFISTENKDKKFDITELYNSAQDIQVIKMKAIKLKK